MKKMLTILLTLVVLVLAGCQEGQQIKPQHPKTIENMKKVVEWSKTVEARFNTILNQKDPNSMISQIGGRFARIDNNVFSVYKASFDPNEPNSLTCRIEALEYVDPNEGNMEAALMRGILYRLDALEENDLGGE